MLNETFSVIFKHCVESFFPFFLIGKRRDYGRRPNSASVLEARAPRRWRIFINNSTLMTCHTTNSYIEQCMVMVGRRKCKLHFGHGQWRSVCLSGCLWYYFSTIWKWRWRHTFTHICTSRIFSPLKNHAPFWNATILMLVSKPPYFISCSLDNFFR